MKNYYTNAEIINFNHYVIACRAHTSSSFCNALGILGDHNISWSSQTADVIINALLFENKADAILYTEDIVIKYICRLNDCKRDKVNEQGLKNIMDRDYRVMTLKKFLDKNRFYEEYEEKVKKEEASENG